MFLLERHSCCPRFGDRNLVLPPAEKLLLAPYKDLMAAKGAQSTWAAANRRPGPMRKENEDMESTAAAPPRPEAVSAYEREEKATDGELLQRIANGDTTAFDTLYRRFARPILGLALRLLRDRSRAEHSVQETFEAI